MIARGSQLELAAVGPLLSRWTAEPARQVRKRIPREQVRSEEVRAFFYGLFMDESLLASKGLRVSRSAVGYVDGYGLRIGRRATLVPYQTERAYGVLMTLRAADLRALYSDDTVADYVSESVSVVLADGTVESAACYNLPEGKLEGANPEYANSLLMLAARLGLPDDYLRQIKKQGT